MNPIGILIVIVLIILLIGGLPVHTYSHSWGYYPSGGIGLVVIILIILLLFRVI
jgi:low affinity Fe/Cu permease